MKKIRLLEVSDCDQIVKVHNDAFQDFFLTNLGNGFLKIYYKAVLNSKTSINIGVFNENSELVAFCVGTKRAKGFHKKILIKNIHLFSFSLFVFLITKPKYIIRLFLNMQKTNNNKNDTGEYSEILSIGVLSRYMGKGIGKILIDSFEQEVRKFYCTRVTLTTDFYGNDGIVAFYKKSGYEVFYDFTVYPDRRMYKLIKNINAIEI